MPTETSTTADNSSCEASSDFEDIWRRLTDSQRRYVIARQDCATKADAATEIGLAASTVYSWPGYVEDAADLLVEHARQTIQAGLDAASAAAIQRLKGIIESGSDKQSRQAAEYVIDQQIGRAVQQQDIDMDATIEGVDVQIHPEAGTPDIDEGE